MGPKSRVSGPLRSREGRGLSGGGGGGGCSHRTAPHPAEHPEGSSPKAFGGSSPWATLILDLGPGAFCGFRSPSWCAVSPQPRTLSTLSASLS